MLKQYAADAAGRGALQYDISYHIREEYQPFEIPQIESLIERTISALADEMYKKLNRKKTLFIDVVWQTRWHIVFDSP